jgi:hypothetical protein
MEGLVVGIASRVISAGIQIFSLMGTDVISEKIRVQMSFRQLLRV